ncbi:MAG: TonB-dependent receptor [Sphingomonas sp.]|nr:TonB-dependent receptor [Sphingomonas sp.]
MVALRQRGKTPATIEGGERQMRITRWPSAGALVLQLCWSGFANAQEAPSTTDNDIVVTGSRAAPRSAVQSSSPVDSYSAADLQARGLGDLSQILQFVSPSLEFAGAVNSGGAANARGPTLRGLGQDEVLILVDGKRRHASSLINFNNTIGRGQVPVDLNLIPVAAIERVEVLRDGAAAQYGSDAIAGVINIILRHDTTGFASVQSDITQRGDGAIKIATVTKGFKLGEGGTIVLTGEVRRLSEFNRADVDSRFGRVTNRQGEAGRTDISASVAAVLPVGGGWEAYANAIYAHRNADNTIQYRVPTTSPVLFPNGFLPLVALKLDDVGGTVGLRHEGAWKADLSDTLGYDQADFVSRDTANTSLGATSPTRFDAGGARYLQNIANLTVSRHFGLLAGADLALGVEHRYERYKIRSGEAASFFGSGAQGFPGFNPPTPVDQGRNAVSAFVDGELAITRSLRLGAAGRYEHYSDFGDKVTGKGSLFFQPIPIAALRATISTGFRAPSLQQSYFSTVTSQSSNGVLVNVGTFAATDPVSLALGGRPLKPETSTNLSGGLVLTPGAGFTLTADAFQVDIDDRIALSESLSGTAVSAILRTAGITNASQVRFFTNALDTRTRGFDIIAGWRGRIGHGHARIDVGYNRSTTTIRRLAANPVLPALPLLATSSIDLLAYAQPRDKLNVAGAFDFGAVSLTATVTRFGTFRFVPVTTEQRFGPEWTTDLGADFRVGDRFKFGIGVINLFDAYADKVAERALTQGGSLPYPEAGGLGFRGREFFARATARF